MSLVRFSQVTKRYESNGTVTLATDRVDLDVPAGQFCVLLGASGAGKSTLLKMVNGLVTPTEGTIRFQETEVNARTLRKIQPQVGMVHQSFHLVPRLSVIENVLSGSLARVGALRALLNQFPETYQRKACQLLARVGLSEHHLYRRARDLSGGQQQRVAIARAFILDPPLILADEPVASLDPATSRDVLNLLRDAARERNTTVVCSLHQVEFARMFADRIVGMRAGRIVFDGTPEEFDSEAEDMVYDSLSVVEPDSTRTVDIAPTFAEAPV
ncbi:MAG: phosphonate ABC transporter ATP-binding protein [Capsulimonadales bacterium]|nr:phosphonate ABC transporter ATP-binding protein [Capsulimonadales bacterium]